jgi:hypothetical protein
MYRRVQMLVGDGRQIAGFEKAFQQQNGLGNAARAQAQGFFKTGDAKGVGIGSVRAVSRRPCP